MICALNKLVGKGGRRDSIELVDGCEEDGWVCVCDGMVADCVDEWIGNGVGYSAGGGGGDGLTADVEDIKLVVV